MKKAIIIIVSVLVIASAAFAGLYFFTDVLNFLKPASTNFSTQAKKLLGTDGDNDYSEYEKFLERLKSASGSQTANLDISANLNLPSKALDSSVQKKINSSKLNISTSYDENSKATYTSANLKYNSKDLISLDAIIKDQSVTLKSSELYNKYLTFDLSKYEEFCKKNDIDVDEDTLESLKSLQNLSNLDSSTLIYDLFYISEKDYKALNKNYGNLEELINSKNYSSKKHQKVSVDGDEISTTAYSLTLAGKDGYEFLTNLVNLMKDDSTLKSLIISKYDILKDYVEPLMESSSEYYSDNLPDLSESDIDDYFEALLDNLESLEDDFEDIEKCVKLTIYSKKDEPVKFEISILDDKNDKDGTTIFTEELSDGKNIYTIDVEKILTVAGVDTSSSTSSSSSYTKSSSTSNISSIASTFSKIIITDKYESTNTSRKGTITISAKPSGESAQELLNIDYDTINSNSEIKSSISISLSSSMSSYLSLVGLSGSGNVSLDYTYHVTGLDSDTQNIELNISGKLASYSAEVNVSGTVSNKSEIPDLTSSNSVDVFALSQEELKSTYTDIINSAADKLPSILSVFDIKVTKNDILSLLPADTETTTNETITETTTEETTSELNPAA